jgi:hypothetical protein
LRFVSGVPFEPADADDVLQHEIETGNPLLPVALGKHRFLRYKICFFCGGYIMAIPGKK